MRCGRGHVKQNTADTNSLCLVDSLVHLNLKDFDGTTDQLLAHLFDDTSSDTGKSHFLQLSGRGLDDLENNVDTSIDNLSQNQKLVVDERLPDLGGLSVDLLNGVVLQNKHT